MNTRRHFRTMQAAFGPYTDNVLYPMHEPSFWTPIRVALTVVYAVALVVVAAVIL